MSVILKIDTIDREKITVSLFKKGTEIRKIEDKNPFGSQVLLPAIIKLLKEQNISFQDIKGIEVNTGPGSFTGIRVGAAVANSLGFALNIPVNGKKIATEFKY